MDRHNPSTHNSHRPNPAISRPLLPTLSAAFVVAVVVAVAFLVCHPRRGSAFAVAVAVAVASFKVVILNEGSLYLHLQLPLLVLHPNSKAQHPPLWHTSYEPLTTETA